MLPAGQRYAPPMQKSLSSPHVVPKLCQSCPKFISKLPQSDLKVVLILSLTFLKVVPKSSQNYQDELIECLSLAELAGIAPNEMKV